MSGVEFFRDAINSACKRRSHTVDTAVEWGRLGRVIDTGFCFRLDSHIALKFLES